MIQKIMNLFMFVLAIGTTLFTTAQNRPTIPTTNGTILPPAGFPAAPSRAMPKPYKEVITDRARTDEGVFKVHRVEDKWYFELPDSLMGREILIVTRLSKSSAGMSNGFSGYAGDQINNNVIRFDKGPNNKVFLRRISFDARANDPDGMYKAVLNSNTQPIMQSFDVRAYGKDSVSNTSSTVIELTEYISGDNDVLFFNANAKASLQVGAFQIDRSYIQTIKSYPINIEIKTVKTYNRGAGGGGALNPFAPPASGAFTVELNSSMLLLPKIPAKDRLYDPRVPACPCAVCRQAPSGAVQ